MIRKKLLFIMVLIGAAPFLAAEFVFINNKTELIYQRFYLIKRLKKAEQMLVQGAIDSAKCKLLDTDRFKNQLISQAAKNISESGSCQALERIWSAFNRYQYLEQEDFSQELVLLMCSVYLLAQEEKLRSLPVGLSQRLNLLDLMMDTHSLGQYPTKAYRYDNEADTVHVNHIAQRYFIIKRLQKAMQFIKEIQNQDKHPFNKALTGIFSIDYTLDIQEDVPFFTHDRVSSCLTDICAQKTLGPLLIMCAEYKQYRYIHDDHFLQEMLKSIFLIYRTLLLKHMTTQTEQIIIAEMTHVLEVYEHFDQLDLDEILDVIDLATDTLLAVQNMQYAAGQQQFWSVFSRGACVVILGLQLLYYMDLL